MKKFVLSNTVLVFIGLMLFTLGSINAKSNVFSDSDFACDKVKNKAKTECVKESKHASNQDKTESIKSDKRNESENEVKDMRVAKIDEEEEEGSEEETEEEEEEK